jgi:UDP-N-acetylglucosamine 2-epimerase
MLDRYPFWDKSRRLTAMSALEEFEALRVLVVFGTRPEAIKMVPVIAALRAEPGVAVEVCVTAQHRQMLDQVLALFGIVPDYDLDVMREAQGLTGITCGVLQGLEAVLDKARPDRVLVHGDTTTALATTLACYYRKVPVGHVEAGLRSGDPYQPWPEENNRRLTDVIADQLYAPTPASRDNLLREGVPPSRIFVTGNTVIDALEATLAVIDGDPARQAALDERFAFLDRKRPILLITGHRRENFGAPFRDLCMAIADLVDVHGLQAVYPVHLNPNVQAPVREILGHRDNVHLIEPLDPLPFVYLMRRAHVILTDSGGIQEEAPSLAKPVFVMRNVTERPEAVAAGVVKLVGTDRARIVAEVGKVLTDKAAYAAMSRAENPYGDGEAAKRIASIVAGRPVADWRPE